MDEYYSTYGDPEQINSELFIYQDLRTDKKNFIARVLLATGKYKLKSTRTNIKSKAVHRAIEFYDDLKLRERRNLPMTDPTYQQCLDYWMRTEAPKLTDNRVKQVERFFTRCVEPFLIEVCDSPMGLDALARVAGPQQLERYVPWRLNTQRWPTSRIPSFNTLVGEVGNFNVVMRTARRAQLIDARIEIPRPRVSDNLNLVKSVRPSINTYTEEQIERLSVYLRTKVIQPTDAEWNLGIVKTIVVDGKRVAVRCYKHDNIRSKNQMYLSRVNTYAAFFILKATGLRLVEMFNLKWEDIKLIDVSFDSKGRMRKVYKFHVKETKTFRKRNSAGVRQVIAPQRLESIFDRIRRENPHHCSPSDYVLNLNGKRRKTLQKVWANVLIGASMPNRKGVAVDCTTHESGTTLDLRHLRSYYVSDMLLNREINPYILERQTGHGISTILDYYLTRQPKRTSMLQLGGWEFPQRLVQETYKM